LRATKFLHREREGNRLRVHQQAVDVERSAGGGADESQVNPRAYGGGVVERSVAGAVAGEADFVGVVVLLQSERALGPGRVVQQRGGGFVAGALDPECGAPRRGDAAAVGDRHQTRGCAGEADRLARRAKAVRGPG